MNSAARRRSAYVLAAMTSIVLITPGTAAHSSPRLSAVDRCHAGQLRVREGSAGAATGHIGFPIHFRNHSDRTCSLRGYPGAAGLNKHGRQVTQAKRTKRGFIGGLKPGHKIPTIDLKPGQTASALIEGADVPVGNQKHCRGLHGLLVTPPNTRQSVHLTHAPPDCTRIEIHPVVRNKDGSQIS